MSFLRDVKTAVVVFRQARKEETAVRLAYQIPIIRTGFFSFTMEACLLHGDTCKAVCAVFKQLPEDTQHALTFTPKEPGEWIERARFWQRRLFPALPPKMYHAVMMRFIGWYAHCVRGRAAA